MDKAFQIGAIGILAVTIAAAQSSPVQATEYRCDTCHQKQSKSQPSTPMGQAAARAVDAQILKDHPVMRFFNGGYTYTIRRGADRVMYTVSDGKNSFSAPLLWAFGFGSIGQTYLYSDGHDIFETRVSYYPPINGLDFTIGQRMVTPTSPEDAAGRRVVDPEKTRCFECHVTEIANETRPGVQCDRCHKGAQQHARAATTQTGPPVTPPKLSQLGKEGVSEFCGGCHRTVQDIVSFRTFNINNVRSQPYRLGTSKCFTSTQDKRISCVGCHDPHEDVVKDAAYYNEKCQACHVAGKPAVKVCSVAKQGCVGCHMPIINFPDGHSRFTDHRIRIVRPGAPFPG